MNDLSAAFAEACAHFAARRPKTLALHQRASAVMPGGNTRSVLYSAPFPLRVAEAKGAQLTDVDGHHYIDFVGEYSAGIYGHSHEVIRKAVADAMTFGINIGAHHEREVAFAEAVTRRFALERVRFTNSGTEANMMALAAARCFTGRTKIMPFHGGYHGGTLYFSKGASPVNAPFECIMGRYNNSSETLSLIDQHADELAAVILEPMLGGGGCIPADRDFLAGLRAICSQRGIMLIFDEVMTSRLHPGGLSAALGIQPDLKTLGKYIGGGMSFGAFGGRKDVMDLFDPSRPDALPHAGTFNNNTLTMTAGRVGIEEIYTERACRALNARGETLKARMNALFERYQTPMQLSGMGSLLTFHFKSTPIHRPEDVAAIDPRLRQLLYLHLVDEGIYVAERGFMALSLSIDDAACDALAGAIEKFIVKYRSELIGGWLN